LWGTAVWGAFTWGGSGYEFRKSEWQSVEGVGQYISWQLQIACGNNTNTDIELASLGLLYEIGEAVA
jgi:hypothetical protein